MPIACCFLPTCLVSRLGLEPRTPALKGQCSTVELPAQYILNKDFSYFP